MTATAQPDRRSIRASVPGVVYLLLLGLGVWLAGLQYERSRRLQGLADSVAFEVMELESELGYGGLIHNFKNFLLRPDERTYLEHARANASRADELLTFLVRDAAELGLELETADLREMIAAYRDRLAVVEDASEGGAAARAIDDLVRYDDTPARLELRTAYARIRDRLVETGDRLVGGHQSIALLSLVLGAVGAALIAIRWRDLKHLRRAERLLNEVERSNDRLARANRALDQFASIAAHDLKGPVRHVSLYGRLIEEDVEDRDCVRAHASALQHSAAYMRGLVDSLLEFARRNSTPPHPEQVDVREIVDGVLLRFGVQIEELDAAVEVGQLPSAHADRDLLDCVFTNLVDNALKYTVPGRRPRLEIGGSVHGDAVELFVADNGVGIPAEFASVVFEPLQRLHGRSSEYEGTGIGLSLVSTIIDSHGGRIWIDEDRETGACLRFRLPAHSSAARADGERAAPAHANAPR